ncbi:hypothetical protein E1B28_007028 [Marasmius oreades]|uniref:Uncharacterized protein n=1 Tax=Marasmius oreades TaxID=181124 RepID=A0A9P7UT08_9AGAR|nr:uncharacterized protein E1B28_007028 [Marasmius oreades]KAG7093347.1 hypothetical protein E1B28_007028 [Marasmius oreades]
MSLATESLEFRGEIGEEISSRDFLKKAEVRLLMMNIAEARFTKKVHLFFKDGSRVQRWYDKLEEASKGEDWDEFRKLFLVEFPAKEMAEVSEADMRKELLTKRITTEELGTKDKSTKQWTHCKFADTLLEYAKAAGIADTSTDILSIHANLPCILRRQMKDTAKNWADFVKEIKEVDSEWIKEEKADEDRIKKLEERIATPETPRTRTANSLANLQLQTPSNNTQRYTAPQNRSAGAVGENLFTSTTGGQGNLFQANGPRRQQQGSQSYGPRLTTEQKEVLKQNLNAYTQQANSPDGINKWKTEARYHQDQENAFDVGKPHMAEELFALRRQPSRT